MAFHIYSLFALFFVIDIAFGLTCYNCESDGMNRQCNWGTQECDESFIANDCFTITVPITSGKAYTKRGCLPEGSCDTVVGGVKSLLGQVALNLDVKCETCTGDKCNSASSLTGFTLVGLIFAAVAFVF